jgi:hypothetical protein
VSYEASFAENFAAFLRENFDTPAEAAVWCKKSPRQIDNYLATLCNPPGPVVAKAFTDPATAESAKRHLGTTNHNDARKPRPLDRRTRDHGGTSYSNDRRLARG